MTTDPTPQSAVLAELTTFVAEAQARRVRLEQLRAEMVRARDYQPTPVREELNRHIRLAYEGIAACTRTIQLCGAAFYAVGAHEEARRELS